MNWRLVLPLCAFGPVMGAVMVTGWLPDNADRFVWFGIVALCGIAVARREPQRALLHGGVVGFVNGAVATLVQALFLDALVANNPYFVEKFAAQPPGFDLEYFVFMLVPFIGVAGGATTGLLAMLSARALASRSGKRSGGGSETSP